MKKLIVAAILSLTAFACLSTAPTAANAQATSCYTVCNSSGFCWTVCS